MKRLPELDGLRGIAIGLVLLCHGFVLLVAPQPHSWGAHALALLQMCWSGVDLFFVLSGFLLGGILIDARGSSTYYATFYRRRFFRIVPLYAALALAYAAAIHAGATGPAFDRPLPWWSFVLFLQNVVIAARGTFDPLASGITWSLAVEEQFYLVLPLVVRFVPPRRLPAVLVGTVVLAPALRAALFYGVPHGGLWAYVSMPARADALALGVLCAVLVRSPVWVQAGDAYRQKMLVLVAGSYALAIGMLLATGETDHHSALLVIAGYSVLGIFYASLLLLALASPWGVWARALRARPLRELGGVAYGTYLLHSLVLAIGFRAALGHDPRIASGREAGLSCSLLVLTVGLARVSWTYFEAKMVQIGQRSSYRP